MEHWARFLAEKDNLYLECETSEVAMYVTHALKAEGIELFSALKGALCTFKHFSRTSHEGYFISQEGRIGLSFRSEKHKFFFVNLVQLRGESFMDMGPGYEAQLHFNTNVLALSKPVSVQTIIEVAPKKG